MPAEHYFDTVEHFALRLSSNHSVLAAVWLERLDQLLEVEARQVFPSHQLLDHIPELIDQIAAYLRAPEDQAIAADTVVMAKAAELGLLRFDQRASVHQVLREYQIFSEILEEFFAREVAELGQGSDAVAVVQVLSRAQQAVRVLMQKTVDAFITRYTETIERQNAQLRNFGRLVSHEIPPAAGRAPGPEPRAAGAGGRHRRRAPARHARSQRRPAWARSPACSNGWRVSRGRTARPTNSASN